MEVLKPSALMFTRWAPGPSCEKRNLPWSSVTVCRLDPLRTAPARWNHERKIFAPAIGAPDESTTTPGSS